MRDRGFTLLEVTIATSLLVVIALGTAHLFAIAIGHNVAARQQLILTLAAGQKADELCAAAAAGPLLRSPPDALQRDVEGFADVSAQAGMSCARRWQIDTPPGYATGLIAIAVRVRIAAGREVQLVTVCEAAGP